MTFQKKKKENDDKKVDKEKVQRKSLKTHTILKTCGLCLRLYRKTSFALNKIK